MFIVMNPPVASWRLRPSRPVEPWPDSLSATLRIGCIPVDDRRGSKGSFVDGTTLGRGRSLMLEYGGGGPSY